MVQHIEKLENIRKKQIELKNKITEIKVQQQKKSTDNAEEQKKRQSSLS